jgi:ankyrin repeat protein
LIDRPDEKWGWTPFMWATFTGRSSEMKNLIDAGADPFTLSPMNRNALHLAAESKHPEVLAFVLEIPDYNGQWFDINLKDYWSETPLHVAASRSAECVKQLLGKGADHAARQENQQVPLHYASLVADAEEKHKIVSLLCDVAEVPVNAQDDQNRTPIFELLNSPDCVQLLISRGADLSIVDKKGRTVLHHACIEDAAESLKILLRSVPKVLHTQPYPKDNTPISEAFQHKSASCAKLLVEENAIGDFDGKDGWRLVHHAANWGNAGVLETVLKHPSYRRGLHTSQGQSAADVAKAAGTWKPGMAKELLLEYDSKGKRAAGPEPPPALKRESRSSEPLGQMKSAQFLSENTSSSPI